jgi:hypothetical protein
MILAIALVERLGIYCSFSRSIISIWFPAFTVTRIGCLVPFTLWVLGRVVAFQPFYASNPPLLSQSIQLIFENLKSHHLNSCFRCRNFQRSFGTTRDMLIPMPCIGRVFHIFCGSYFSYFATTSPCNMMELSIVKRVFLGAEWRWQSLNILFVLCGSPSRLIWLVFALLTL